MLDKRGIFISETYLLCSLLTVSGATGAAMATSGEFRFLTLGLLLVVVGLTGGEIATSEEFTLQDIESLSVFPETAVEQLFNGYVYLIEEGNPYPDASYFKIGFSVNPNERLRNLQTGNPRKLTLVYFQRVRDHVACEGRLKNALRNYESTLGGGTEWYTASINNARYLKGIFTRTVNRYCQ